MIANNSPDKIQLPFAEAGAKNTIPVASQIGINPGAASFTDGWPPLTRTPIVAGGIPPSGLDFNGIFNAITAIQQWQSAGGAFKYDASFSTAVGGYPKGAVLAKATNDGFWLNTVDSNTSNPDTGGANWSDLGASFGGRPGHTYTSNDWAYLDKPGGLMIQWGNTGPLSSSVDTTITLPIAFPNAFLIMVLTQGYTSGTGVVSYSAASNQSGSKTQFVARASLGGQGNFYIAIGA